jgi:hypothetical protein
MPDTLRRELNEARAECDRLREALRYVARAGHYHAGHDNSFDECSWSTCTMARNALSPAPECVECGCTADAPIHHGEGKYRHTFGTAFEPHEGKVKP